MLIETKAQASEDLAKAKRRIAKNHKITCPSNIVLLKKYHDLLEKKKIKKAPFLELLLKTRPIRSLSGIVNISVLTKPYPCPGKCLYCPQEKGIPKSYVSGEPAVERAKKLKYSPFWQVKKRIETLKMEGHPTDKIELRIVGGTWSHYPKRYQSWFIKRCFEAANSQTPIVRDSTSTNLKRTQRINEKAKNRIVGLSIETRPDFINKKEINRLRKLGVTMVELGVQSIYDDILKTNLRGHGQKEIVLATKLLKNAGFKVLYQMMPNLPGSNAKKDLKMFRELSSDPRFQPDLLKIYPCALLKQAPLFKLWQGGRYRPYTKKALIGLIKSVKKIIPYYVRIQRITRDIPSSLIVKGPAKISNLRQILLKDMKENGWQCKCIRCREVKGGYDPKDQLSFFRQDYLASGGKEIFLSMENNGRTKLHSLLRLRITKVNPLSAIIREVHTFGPLQRIKGGRTSFNSTQHRGLGKKLIEKAERITKGEFGIDKLYVIAGIGAREYYRKLGYELKGTYMAKRL